MKDWGQSGMSFGIALLGYDLFYVPLMRGWGQEPWAAWEFGLTMLGAGTILFIIAEIRKERAGITAGHAAESGGGNG